MLPSSNNHSAFGRLGIRTRQARPRGNHRLSRHQEPSSEFDNTDTTKPSSTESGNVIVEFVGVMIVLVVPALLALLAASSLLLGQAAVTAAVRDGARAFVRAESAMQGRHHATQIATEAFEQRGVDADVTVDFACSAIPCLTPGASVTTTVRAHVLLTSVGMTVTLDESLQLPVDELREERE
ncbi:MAG: hypothetical protein QM705_14890 [Ancrocorticia sp.]